MVYIVVREKTILKNEIYFITFTILGWKNIFTEDKYRQLLSFRLYCSSPRQNLHPGDSAEAKSFYLYSAEWNNDLRNIIKIICMFKKNNKVNKVVHLKFIFRLDQIAKWVENNFNENLLDNISFDNKDNLLYKIDLLPHPNGMDSLFYHRYSNAFSSYLDAFETRGEYFRKFSDKVCGIEWTLREGYLLFFVLLSNEYKEARKLLLIAPTDEILLMQIYGEAQSDRLLDEGIVNISYFKGKTEKVKKEALGFCGGGVRYSNNLCQVDIYPSKLMDYNREK